MRKTYVKIRSRLANFSTYNNLVLTVLCGTGHVVYTRSPTIYDSNQRRYSSKRPMAVSSIASQMV
ncbi:MAG: anaerobic C4-dicarboxylate transporter family protein [Veillonella sp.]